MPKTELQGLGDALGALRKATGWSTLVAVEKAWPADRITAKPESRARLVLRWEHGICKPTQVLFDDYMGPYGQDANTKVQNLLKVVETEAKELSLKIPRPELPPGTTEPKREPNLDMGDELTIPQEGGGFLATGWTILGGTPANPYALGSIIMRLDPVEVSLPDELSELRAEMAAEIERKRALGDSDIWNERRFALRRIVHTRAPEPPDMGLRLEVQLTDYAAFAGITLKMDSEDLVSKEGAPTSIRQKYFSEFDRDKPNLYLTHSFGVNILVISKDGRALFVQRSKHVAASPGLYNISVNEGMQYPRDIRYEQPSILATAQVGLFEELGVADLDGDLAAKVEVLNFGVVHRKNQYALLSCLELPFSASEIDRMFVIQAKDRPLEVRNLYKIPFEFKHLVKFVESHGPWASNGLATLYLTMARKWGFDETEHLLEERPLSAGVVVA